MDASWRASEGLDPEYRHFYANPDGPESWSRWDMQISPPDILITNYSMLNIMLMRDIESPIFAATSEWLRASDDNVVTLVVDELHSYRGTPGTEVAYILRLLAMRLGLAPNSPQLRILATSASLDQSPASREFLSGFFGRNGEAFEIVSDPPAIKATAVSLAAHASAFAHFARTVCQAEVPTDPDQALRELDEAVSLDRIRMDVALREACRDPKSERVRATKETEVAQRLFGTYADRDTALHGFLLAGASEGPRLRIRGHLFYRTLGNLWACSNPACGSEGIGTLSGEAKYACETCGSRVLDLIVCTCCGEAFLGGYRSRVAGGVALTPDTPDLESAPEVGALRRTVSEYAVYWPTPNAEIEPQHIEYQARKTSMYWNRVAYAPESGILAQAANEEATGWVFGANSDTGCLPPRCPRRVRCDYARSESSRARRHHYGTTEPGFARWRRFWLKGCFREMGDGQDRRLRKFLVLFVDSRSRRRSAGHANRVRPYPGHDPARTTSRIRTVQTMSTWCYRVPS